MSGWAQAIGAVLAIVAGFAGTAFQLAQQKKEALTSRSEAGRAAYLIAYDAIDIVSDRLESALQPNKSRKKHALRGSRTSEMVSALREFDTSRLPDNMLADFIRLRSRLVAINDRITEIYRSESKVVGDALNALKDQRRDRLLSAVKTQREALTFFKALESAAQSHHSATPQQLTARPTLTAYRIPPP